MDLVVAKEETYESCLLYSSVYDSNIELLHGTVVSMII